MKRFCIVVTDSSARFGYIEDDPDNVATVTIIDGLGRLSQPVDFLLRSVREIDAPSQGYLRQAAAGLAGLLARNDVFSIHSWHVQLPIFGAGDIIITWDRSKREIVACFDDREVALQALSPEAGVRALARQLEYEEIMSELGVPLYAIYSDISY